VSESTNVLDAVRIYYEGRLQEFGAIARGVDWNSAESQANRFDELVPADALGSTTSLLDYGCGYGALLPYLRDRGWSGLYCGYDVSPSMTAAARQLNPDVAEFVDEAPAQPFERTVASGLFNVRLHFDDDVWHSYITTALDTMWELTTGAMAFNMLTSHSDADHRRQDLYYGDPGRYLNHCLARYSRHARLHHGYGLYEFTIEVRR
jgi:SAM-dependent methyltransferase